MLQRCLLIWVGARWALLISQENQPDNFSCIVQIDSILKWNPLHMFNAVTSFLKLREAHDGPQSSLLAGMNELASIPEAVQITFHTLPTASCLDACPLPSHVLLRTNHLSAVQTDGFRSICTQLINGKHEEVAQ